MFSHFPVLSAQQRLTPYYDNATAAFSALGDAAPQVYFNGHDHILAQLSSSSITGYGGAPIGFYTTGAAGISDCGKSLGSKSNFAGNGPVFTAATYPGYAGGYAAAGSSALSTLAAATYGAQPATGTASAVAYNPDVNYTQFWSDYNGFTITVANATTMAVSFYLVNCSQVISTGACAPGYIGPLATQYFPAKNLASPPPLPSPSPPAPPPPSPSPPPPSPLPPLPSPSPQAAQACSASAYSFSTGAEAQPSSANGGLLLDLVGRCVASGTVRLAASMRVGF